MTPFNRLFATAALVQAADQIVLAALPVTAVVTMGAGPGLAGALVAAQTAAWLVVSLPAGVLTDRLPRRAVLLMALATAAVAATAAAAAALAKSVVLLAVAAFLAASGTVAFVLVQIGLVPLLVPAAGLPRANARLELARAVAATVAPSAVGVLAVTVSPLAAYGAAALLAAAALSCALGSRPPATVPTGAKMPLLRAAAAGGRFVAGHPLLRAIALCALLWNFAFVALVSVFIPFALRHLGADAAAAGLAQGANGLGMILGAALAPAIFARCEPRTVLVFGPASSALGALMLACAPALGGLGAAALAFGLIGFGPMLWLVMQTSLRQLVTPPHLIGRVTATIQAAIYGVRPLGALAGGLVGQSFGLGAAMAMVAAGFAASAAVALSSPLARLRAMPSAEAA